MNHYDAIQIRERVARNQPVDPRLLAEADAFIATHRNQGAAPATSPDLGRTSPKPVYLDCTAPPYSAMCECGRRYGMHRVNDFACPNQKWSTGNGEPQWLERKWKRA